jgi:hypothetical protein
VSQYSSPDLVGHWVLDRRGRPLGEVVGVVHHWNGSTSLLVQSGSGRSCTGLMVSPERTVVAEDGIQVHRPHQHHREPGLGERIGRAMWPSGTVSDR